MPLRMIGLRHPRHRVEPLRASATADWLTIAQLWTMRGLLRHFVSAPGARNPLLGMDEHSDDASLVAQLARRAPRPALAADDFPHLHGLRPPDRQARTREPCRVTSCHPSHVECPRRSERGRAERQPGWPRCPNRREDILSDGRRKRLHLWQEWARILRGPLRFRRQAPDAPRLCAVFEVSLDFAGRRAEIARGCRKVRWKTLPEGWYVTILRQNQGGSCPTRITRGDVENAAAKVRAFQFRNARGGEQIHYTRMRAGAIDVSLMPGTRSSVRLTIRDNGSDTSKTAFKTNMRKLARTLAWDLGQRVVLTWIGEPPGEARTRTESGERLSTNRRTEPGGARLARMQGSATQAYPQRYVEER